MGAKEGGLEKGVCNFNVEAQGRRDAGKKKFLGYRIWYCVSGSAEFIPHGELRVLDSNYSALQPIFALLAFRVAESDRFQANERGRFSRRLRVAN